MKPIINRKQAEAVAVLLFHDDVHDGGNCRNEIGREGLLCTFCFSQHENWQKRIDQVHKALNEVLV